MGEEEDNKCRRCGKVGEEFAIHPIKLESKYQRICSPCVLETHPDMYCPVCLQLTNQSPPSSLYLCSSCQRAMHISCRSPSEQKTSLCPRCINPNWHPVQQARNKKLKSANGKQAIAESSIVLLAARISSAILHSISEAKYAEACKLASESVQKRNEAKEALAVAMASAVAEDARSEQLRQEQQTLQQPPREDEQCLPDKASSEIHAQNLGTNLLIPASTSKAPISNEPNGPVR